MIRLHVGADDLGRACFAISPIWETVASVRTLTSSSDRMQLHRPWHAWVRGRLDGVELDLLTALIRPAGYIPDFPGPSPNRRASSFQAALAQTAAGSAVATSWQLRHLASHPVAASGPRRADRARLLRNLADQPDDAITRVTAALDRYWRVAIDPHWPRLQALLRNLHPSVSYDGSTVRIVKYYDGDVDLSGRGLLLVPCVFAWPDVLVLTAEPNTPTVSYSPRGVGTLWQQHASTDDTALTEILGRTRVSLLSQLDLPMSTTQLATALTLTAPTLNVHLQASRI